METIKNTLEIKIDEARMLLSKETRNAIDDVSWKLIIQGFNNKYNEDQLDSLETETELLLCGILSPDTYKKEIENRMGISKVETGRLLEEMDKLIFKKIQEKLIYILSYKKEEIEEKMEVGTNSFSVDLKTAINQSDYQIKIYEIGKKYNLPIDQMNVLEKVINKIINGEINPDKIETELKEKIQLPADKLGEIVNDINQEIFIKIQNILKSEWEKNKSKDDNIIETINKKEVPLPPYKELDEEVPTPNYAPTTNLQKTAKETEDSIYKNNGIEMIEETKEEIKDTHTEKEKTMILENSGIDIIKEKLSGPTTSNTVISDYSIPKITSVEKDPYHEKI